MAVYMQSSPWQILSTHSPGPRPYYPLCFKTTSVSYQQTCCHCSFLTSFHIYTTPHHLTMLLRLVSNSRILLVSAFPVAGPTYTWLALCLAPPLPSSDPFCMLFCCYTCFVNMAAVFGPFQDALKGSICRYVYSLLLKLSFSPSNILFASHTNCVPKTI